MKLDFMVYKRNKKTGEKTELAYSRKSWEQVDALNVMPQSIEVYSTVLEHHKVRHIYSFAVSGRYRSHRFQTAHYFGSVDHEHAHIQDDLFHFSEYPV